MRVRNAVIALVAGMLPLVACSSGDPGGGSTGGGPTASATGPTATTGASPSDAGHPVESVEVEVDGRVLTGSCSGEAEQGEPTVILDAGLGNGGSQLLPIASSVEDLTRVCAYDRAGNGSSDPVDGERTLSDLVGDLEAFLHSGKISPPYVLVGQSLGGTIAFRYAQTHPAEVAGFVVMNPAPPCSDYIERARAVETKDELQTIEVDFCDGINDEAVDLFDSDLILEEPMPDVPYVVMYAEDCPGEFCDRIRPILEEAMSDLAALNDQGMFVPVDGAGHEIFATNLEEVVEQIQGLVDGV